MVYWSIKKTLNLRSVQINGHEAISSSRLEKVCHQAGRDRLTASVLFILAGVPVKGHNHRDAFCGGALERINHDQLFHDPLINGRGVALKHECITTADRFTKPDEDLAVSKIMCGNGGQINA